MASFVRVKRRCDEEPSNILLIACKKKKYSENEKTDSASYDEPVTAVVKFAGTINDQGKNVIKHLAKTDTKKKLKENFKKHVVDIKNMLCTQIKNNSIENRYKIVNRHRLIDESNAEESEDNITIIDIEDSFSSTVPVEKDSETVVNFVYDLYYTEHGIITVNDDVLYLQGIEEEFVYDLEDEEPEYSSDDSNSESRWNDYPDSEEDENEERDDDEEDSLCTGIAGCTLNKSYEDAAFDSDSSIDDFIYSVDKKDVQNFGYKYARYKAKTKRNLATGNYDDDDDDDDDDELNFDYEDIDESTSNDELNNSDSDHFSSYDNND